MTSADGRSRRRKEAKPEGAFETVYEWVRRVPRGRVITYGRISDLMVGRISPLAVGWALSQCPDDVPWYRVVNAKGGCSTDRRPDSSPGRQRRRLESEGVKFRGDGTLDLGKHSWNPR